MEKYPNINILLNVDRDYIPKAEFVLRTFCYILRLNPKFNYGSHYEGTHLYYGKDTTHSYPIKIHYAPTTAEFFEKRELYPLENVNFCYYKKEYIPFLFSMGGQIFSLADDHCFFRKDIVASGFYFLTCWHEYIMSLKGVPKGRVDYKESLQYRWSFTEIPVVDVYCQLLLYTMELFCPEFIRDIHWHNDNKFVLSLSHDIDYWQVWDGKTLGETLKYNFDTFWDRPVNSVYKSVGHSIHKAIFYDAWKVIRKMQRIEQNLGATSTWFLLARNDFEDNRQNYLFDVKAREQVIDRLGQQEIGLHGSPESAFDPLVLKEELDNLRKMDINPKGFRTHYLHFDYQRSFSILEEAGILYDSTLGYWESIGFRAGISFPFFPFNIKENRPFRVLEIPLIVMDTTLISKKAMNLNTITAYRNLTRLIDLAAKYQSHLSLLWHNNTFDPIDYPGWGTLYQKTIRYAKSKGGWVTTLQNVYDEWVTLSY